LEYFLKEKHSILIQTKSPPEKSGGDEKYKKLQFTDF